MRTKSSKQRSPALCINDSNCLRASESCSEFPGVDHEGRQTIVLVVICAKTSIERFYKTFANYVTGYRQ